MQITLNQDEIVAAIDDYVRKQINISDDQEVLIDLKAGRGENGYTATLDIVAKAAKGKPKPVASRAGSGINLSGPKTVEETPATKPTLVKTTAPVTKAEEPVEPETTKEEVQEDIMPLKDEVSEPATEDVAPVEETAAAEPVEVPVRKPGSIFSFAKG